MRININNPDIIETLSILSEHLGKSPTATVYHLIRKEQQQQIQIAQNKDANEYELTENKGIL